MTIRGNSAPKNELGTYTYYCRACGTVHKQADMPIMCTSCGGIFLDRGFGISGDNSLSETSAYVFKGKACIRDIDKIVR